MPTGGTGVVGRVGAATVAARVGVAVAVGVVVGVGVGGAANVTTTGADSCALPKLSTTRKRKRYRPGAKPLVFHTPSSALSTACAR